MLDLNELAEFSVCVGNSFNLRHVSEESIVTSC